MRSLLFATLLIPSSIFAGDFRAFLETHCLDCHDSDAKKGDLDLSGFTDEAAVMRNRAIWRSVYEKIESHQMPPPKQKSQPTEAQRHELLAWIMDIAARPDPALGAVDPGKPVLRRITRLEYNNSVRDLFGLEMDVFMFPERLPISDKSYYQPASGKMGDAVKVPLREYGGKYQVLCRQLGLPGDNRAEHGYRNRGDAMDFSPLLLEQYLAAANEIVNTPELPARSAIFAELIGVDPSKLPPLVKKPLPQGFGDAASVPLASEYVPAIDKPKKPDDSPDWIGDFRRMIAEAHADGRGGVFDVPAALSNQTIAGKGGLIKATFGSRTFTINPNADLWLVSFATAEEASGPALLTNKEKGAKLFELTFDIRSDNEDEGIERLGVCVLGRNKQSGEVKLTAVFTDATETTVRATISEGAGGTTFFSFAAHPGETIKKLIVDGSQFSGDYVLLDDIGIVTNGVKQIGFAGLASSALLSVQGQAKPEKQEKQTRVSVSRSPRDRLAAFIERAFRRTVTEEEVARFHALFEADKKTKSESEAMKTAVAAVLASPSFLYLEANGIPSPEKVTPLEDAEIATRLACFLWASTPDDELLKLAQAGKLREPAMLEAQALRLLRDEKSRELSESFAVQWLRLDQLYTSKPDRDLFKAFYSGPQGKATLHGAAMVEALLLFETVLAEDRSILDFISPGYTWLNPGLAKLYDIPFGEEAVVAASAGDGNRELKKKNDLGSQWRRVKLNDANRGGFMTMSAPMVVTSLPFRTSPVKRGAWLLETIFNRPPTEPKVAFAIENDTKKAAQQMSIREKFEAHRSKAACYSCHIRLDPPGFALQRFDPVGAWDASADAKSEWQGRPFDGPAGFKALLEQDPHEFTRGFIEHLLSYAINRPLEIYDMPTVERIEQAAKADGWKFSRVIVEIVKSYPFNHIRNTP